MPYSTQKDREFGAFLIFAGGLSCLFSFGCTLVLVSLIATLRFDGVTLGLSICSAVALLILWIASATLVSGGIRLRRDD